MIHVFNIRPGADENIFGKLDEGHSRLTARFDKELPEPVTAIVYGLFPSRFMIDKSRAVVL